MGEVYRARDSRLGRDVAIKILPPECATVPDRLRRFEHEARAASALSHPNILTVFDIGSHAGTPFLVTEMLEGETLRHLVSSGPLPPTRAVALARQVASGLAAAHEKGIVHRDIKPENLLLTRDGIVKILDFGLAKLACPQERDGNTLSIDTTQSGSVMGTAGYMSPEQVRAQPVDGRADIFSLGCVLYELLSGQRAFEGVSQAETMTAILHDDPPPLRPGHKGVTPGLEAVVRRCLEKRAEDRFRSVHDLAVALETLSLESGPAPGVPGRPRTRSWLLVGLAATGTAIVVALAWSALHRREGEVPFSSGEPHRLTSGPGWEAEPALSPDGTLVAFTTYGEGSADVFVLDIGGGEPLRLTADPAADLHPGWSPDGASILFASDRGGSRSIWRVPRLGGSATLLIQDADYPAVSPDGRFLAFSRSVAGRLRIHMAPISRPDEAIPITTDRDGLWEHVDPAWSPDGLTLVYADQRDLWEVPTRGGPARPLTSEHENDREPEWSADGRWVYFASKRGATDAVWRVASQGGVPQRVTMGTGPESHPAVSRDGSRLVYSTFSEQYDVTVVDVDGRVALCGAVVPSCQPDLPPVLNASLADLAGCRVRDPDLAVWLAGRQALISGHPLGASQEGKRSAHHACVDCTWLGVCSVCPLSVVLAPGAYDPDRIPAHQCGWNRLMLAHRQSFAGQEPVVREALQHPHGRTNRHTGGPLTRRATGRT